MGKNTKISVAVAVIVLGTSLVACDDGRSGAETAVQQYAAAVAAVDLKPVAFDGKDAAAATDQLRSVFAALEPQKPEVQAGEVALDGDNASAPLNYTWKFGDAEWKYTVPANFRKSGDKWLAVWDPATLAPGLADSEILTKGAQSPPRADILGAGDVPLVTYRPVVNVGIDKPQLGGADPADSATKLAALVGVDPAGYVQRVQASGAEAFVSAITLREEGRTVTNEQIAAIPGARAIPGSIPLAPSRTFARAVLGTVGEATAEQIEASEGALTAGDVTGIGGLQQQYDDQLRGTDAVVIRAQRADLTREQIETAATDPRRVLFEVAPTPGTPLKTTIDPRFQSLAESTLEDVGPASAIVALRPSSGAVLAVASGPGSNGYNTAMLGQYAPGSIFKMVDSLAMFRNGLTPESKVQCTPTLTVDGRTFKNAEGYPATSLGSVSLRDAFAHSCNTAFIAARDTVSQGQLEAAALAMGIAVEAPSLGAEAFLGSVPGEATGTEHAASMIGQGKVLLSPLAAAMMAGSVAKGAPVSPQLVTNPDGGAAVAGTTSGSAAPAAQPSATATAEAPTTASDEPITAAEAASLADMMRAVVTSGHAGFLSTVPGAPVGAKTGTAEFGKENPPKTHAWIVAVQGDLAVAVFVEDGGLGATTSGPLLKEFLTAAG
ncbi:penicillin-binding transpeptidase domain-containing protein [Pseudarthrobacter sp. NamB4]|uniref:penicillin-binding transpeptidase domain-containing protein n=1 Tax=Pseudarthrobacter sp. NamB4 TaxID=2576837 RepID=UPI0010FDB64C|nr:penicillin-binding transpeptidase domain-containing protein [Pseudarthrobacter sp. NamB4]TLM73745.1 penicillin-binding protein [Pseudarthrobacter sp. NamB4]